MQVPTDSPTAGTNSSVAESVKADSFTACEQHARTQPAMRLFAIAIGPREAPRLDFAVFAPDGETATRQNHCLALPGEAMTVTESRAFRVQGDWEGGGFGYTIPARDAAEARAWGEFKARFHPDAVVTVEARA